jgi:uncharacterized protein YdaU (DUF1376 family)
VRVHDKTKKNPLNNKAIMNRLNPFAAQAAKLNQQRETERHNARAAAIKAKRSKAGRAEKTGRSKEYQRLQGELEASYAAAQNVLDEEEKAGNYVPGDTSEEDED